MKHYPQVRLVEWLGEDRLRISFALGNFVEVKEVLVSGASKKARVVDMGMGIDPGNGRERSGFDLYRASGRWLRKRASRKSVRYDALRAKVKSLVGSGKTGSSGKFLGKK